MELDPNFKAHFPNEVSQEVVDYAKNVIFYDSRYVFINSKGPVQKAYCTHCQKDYYIKGKRLKHNQEWCCDECFSPVVVKSDGMGRKRLFAEAYFVWYEKSQIDSHAIVAMGFHVLRDYQDYQNTQTMFDLVAMYTFEPGHSEMRYKDWYNGNWLKPKNIRSEYSGSMQFKYCDTSYVSIENAVKGTSFQYSTWERYTGIDRREDMVHFFEIAAKYSCIEYLTKMGFQSCVRAKLVGNRTYGAINWNGKTIEKVLRLSKAEIKELKKSTVPLRPDILSCYQVHKKHGLILTFDEARLLGACNYMENVTSHLKVAPLKTLSKYMLKQLKKQPNQAVQVVLSDLRDYWGQARDLGMDLSQEHVLFPNNLHNAHKDTTRRVKVKVDAKLNGLISKRLPELNKYTYADPTLHVRPVTSSIELFDEGKELSHCVGGYASRYALGETDLYVLRYNDLPNQPYYTVEVQKKRVVQCRGYKNKSMTKEVAAFIDAFETRLHKTKGRKAQPA